MAVEVFIHHAEPRREVLGVDGQHHDLVVAMEMAGEDVLQLVRVATMNEALRIEAGRMQRRGEDRGVRQQEHVQKHEGRVQHVPRTLMQLPPWRKKRRARDERAKR